MTSDARFPTIRGCLTHDRVSYNPTMLAPSNRSKAELSEGLSLLRRAFAFTSEIASKLEQGGSYGPIGEFVFNLEKDSKRAYLAVLLIGSGPKVGEFVGSDGVGAEGITSLLATDPVVATPPSRKNEPRIEGCALDAAGRADRPGSSTGIGDARHENEKIRGVRDRTGAASPDDGLLVLAPKASVGMDDAPGLLSHLLSQAGLIIVSAMNRSGATYVEELLGNAGALPPTGFVVLTEAYGERKALFGAPGTWPSLLDVLKDPSGDLRRALAAAHHSRRLEAAIGLLARLIEREARALEARLQVVNRREADSSAERQADRKREVDLKATLDAIRREREGGQFERGLNTALEERRAERMLPSSPGQKRIRDYLEGLSEEIFVRERAGHALRLRVRDDVPKSAGRLLRAQVREDFEADLVMARGCLVEEALSMSARVASISGSSASIDPAPLDASGPWDAVEKRIHLDYQFEGEVLHKGWLDLIAQGGRLPRTALMLLSTFGFVATAYGPLRFVLGPVLLGSVAWTWFDFRRERRERIARGLKDVRKQLGDALRKLYEQSPREGHKRMVQELVASRRKLEEHAERLLQEWARKRENVGGLISEELAKEKLFLDRRLRDFGHFPRPLEQARQAAIESRRVLEGISADLLDGWQASEAQASP